MLTALCEICSDPAVIYDKPEEINSGDDGPYTKIADGFPQPIGKPLPLSIPSPTPLSPQAECEGRCMWPSCMLLGVV